MPRPTREAYAAGVLALVIFFIAFNLQSGWVYAVDAILVGVVLAGLLSASQAVRGLSITRTLPAEAVEAEPVRVRLALRARGRRFFLHVRDNIPGLEPATVSVTALDRRGALRTYTTMALRRGVYTVGTVSVWSRGLTGLFEARREVPVPGDITVYPRYWRLRRFALAEWTPALQAAGSARQRGGLEFHNLRDYRPGDSVRHIHWRSSARQRTLMVREFEQELPGAITLVVDTRPAVQAGTGNNTTFEDLVRAAASVTWWMTSGGATVRLLASTGSRPLDLTGGWAPILRALAALQPEGSQTPSAVCGSVGLGHASAIVVLSPDPGVFPALASLGVPAAGILAEPTSYRRHLGSPRVSGTGRGSSGPGIPLCVLRKGDDLRARLEQMAP